ncbi:MULTISPECIES: AzlD domain-containing protein [Paraburkholderia]|jgi:hypothetical protein|uniref:Uncharacterized protein n=1 Tax=Paraburkholderia largidicola TaxID=3014751 RepID=A0A7I8C2D8_9BURK|nr:MULTISPECIES: AzlD domain-containing protein [Paraburkholderia]BCF94681.1 hypothetical protein PPGU16_77480 [Paraburkholderia sp. PGU16]GJH03183.1 AzlD domain-containing protein [Paraburkholderia terrae]
MNEEILAGIAILFAVSVIVRIAPTFSNLNLSAQASFDIKNILPIAVLINLLVYCVVSELHHDSIAAVAGFTVLGMMILSQRINLLVMVVLASVTYIAAGNGFHG